MHAKVIVYIVSYIGVAAVSAVAAGFITNNAANIRQSASAGKLNNRFTEQQRAAGETITGLEQELERERGQIQRAREIIAGLTESVKWNVRSLSEALTLVREIRTQLQVLEAFLSSGNPGSGST